MAEGNADDDVEMENKFSYSRCSSAGSLHTLTSSANNTDDEDSDIGHLTVKDRRREAHTQAEQKRRDAIKKGYEVLQDLVPMCQNAEQNPTHKLSKATVLQKSIDYIQVMQNGKKKQEEEVAKLRREAVGMAIMKSNYEQIVQAHQNQPGQLSKQVPDEIKFQVFRAVLDSLFQTFDPCLRTGSFAEMSGSVISWIEEHCQPQVLREVMSRVLEQLQQYDPSAHQMESSLPP